MGKNFHGKCYVFDNRIVKEVNRVNPKIIGKCYVTGEKTDRMVNCANTKCNKHFPLSGNGASKYKGCCSRECMESDSVREFNGTGFYQNNHKASNNLIVHQESAFNIVSAPIYNAMSNILLFFFILYRDTTNLIYL